MTEKQGDRALGKLLVAGFALWGAYSWGHSDGRADSSEAAYGLQAAVPYVNPSPDITDDVLHEPEMATQADGLAEGEGLASYQPEAEAYTAPTYSTAPSDYGESAATQDARYAQLYQGWNAAEKGRDASDSEAVSPPIRLPTAPAQTVSGATLETSGQTTSYTPATPIYTPPVSTSSPRYGCSESGSCYGDISTATGRPKTVYVPGYYKSNGKYVRGYYRSN